jgi:hypothetical protein
MGLPVVVIDCAEMPAADFRQVDAFARLQLILRRRRCELRLANPQPGLVDLISLAGLAGVLGVQPGRQAEEGEEPGRVEEESQLRDLAP